ncbi:peptidase U32 family protein [Nitratireductor sp. ZSWI3]|uniref:ubiquinone anaerobic biosynthesis protein UbiU n=1 Tax=Nitratireductor sp. ZSWI3 TaxID=2966359 RepID=UPI00214F75CF|nr:peptidase U32 family protein [Nitratireductor sp. ZSWI3]MCR4265245.1 U32 family peptidase [Nitratireductor sp. ZSWI3]
MPNRKTPELVCPAGTPAALRAAVDAGADSIYCGFQDETNARNFPGLNFTPEELAAGIGYAHARGARVLVAINTFSRAGAAGTWHGAVDTAAALGADAVILADIGLLDYAATRHPELRRHLSVQAAAANADAIRFYSEAFGVKRVVLPRVLTVSEIAAINREISCETEVFVFGGLCVMAEGRCSLSSYATGKSPNMNGVCSPASHVHYREEGGELVSRLGEFTMDRVPKHHPAPYPTLCKGCFTAGAYRGHVFEDPVSLDAATLIPQLLAAGVSAFKIEGRQRSRSYIRDVVTSFRRAVDAHASGLPIPAGTLQRLSEGQTTTAGAYRKTWR